MTRTRRGPVIRSLQRKATVGGRMMGAHGGASPCSPCPPKGATGTATRSANERRSHCTGENCAGVHVAGCECSKAPETRLATFGRLLLLLCLTGGLTGWPVAWARADMEGLADSLDLVPIGAWYGQGRKASHRCHGMYACCAVAGQAAGALTLYRLDDSTCAASAVLDARRCSPLTSHIQHPLTIVPSCCQRPAPCPAPPACRSSGCPPS
jgi:hypothetical protein